MTDLEKAISALSGHTIVLCKGNDLITSDKRGISPMLDFIDTGYDLSGYSAADIVVGKAAAMLFVKAKIKAVFAKNISESGKNYLQSHGITVEYENISDKIINRKGDGICPMEEATLDTDDFELGYELIKKKRNELLKKA